MDPAAENNGRQLANKWTWLYAKKTYLQKQVVSRPIPHPHHPLLWFCPISLSLEWDCFLDTVIEVEKNTFGVGMNLPSRNMKQ